MKTLFIIEELAYWSKNNGYSQRLSFLYSVKTGERLAILEDAGNVRSYVYDTCHSLFPDEYQFTIQTQTNWLSYKDWNRNIKHNLSKSYYTPEEVREWISTQV